VGREKCDREVDFPRTASPLVCGIKTTQKRDAGLELAH
jgi:hypothetical protein